MPTEDSPEIDRDRPVEEAARRQLGRHGSFLAPPPLIECRARARPLRNFLIDSLWEIPQNSQLPRGSLNLDELLRAAHVASGAESPLWPSSAFGLSKTESEARHCPEAQEHRPPGRQALRMLTHDEEQSEIVSHLAGSGQHARPPLPNRSSATQIDPLHIGAEIASSMPAATAKRRRSPPCSPTIINPTGIVPGW